MVKKKNSDDIRLCVNYKKLNDATVNDPMPMPETDDIVSKIAQSDMFSTVDISRGYYAIGMTDRATQNYRFLVMPFGLKTAGATYTRLLKKVLKMLKPGELH